MQGSDLGCCIDQIMKVKSQQKLFYFISLFTKKIKEINISYDYKQVFWFDIL